MSRYPTIDQPTAPLDGTGLPYQRLDTPLAAFGGNGPKRKWGLFQQGRDML